MKAWALVNDTSGFIVISSVAHTIHGCKMKVAEFFHIPKDEIVEVDGYSIKRVWIEVEYDE